MAKRIKHALISTFIQEMEMKKKGHQHSPFYLHAWQLWYLFSIVCDENHKPTQLQLGRNKHHSQETNIIRNSFTVIANMILRFWEKNNRRRCTLELTTHEKISWQSAMNLSSVKTLVFENFKNNVDVYSLHVCTRQLRLLVYQSNFVAVRSVRQLATHIMVLINKQYPLHCKCICGRSSLWTY